MKNLALLIMFFGLILSSCTQDELADLLGSTKKDVEQEDPNKDRDDTDDDTNTDQKLYRKVVEEIVFSDDCKCPVSGIVEYYNEKRELVYTIDYGDGECDRIAYKIVGDKIFKIKLTDEDCTGGRNSDKLDDSKPYKKKVVKELVYISSCKYPVAGIVEYYNADGKLLYTLDYGDGECDNIVTKIVGDRRYIIRLD